MTNPELTGQPSAFDRKAHALLRATQSPSRTHRSASRKLARGLGWLGIGIGLVELLAARRLGRLVGPRGREALLQACGVREIVSGMGILASQRPATTSGWMWSRVAGDALDLAILGAAAAAPSRGGHPLAAMVAVAKVAAVDVGCARALRAQAHAARQTIDYGDRSGFGQAVESMREPAAVPTLSQPFEQPASRTAADPAP